MIFFSLVVDGNLAEQRGYITRVDFFAHVIAFSLCVFLCASFKALSVFQEQHIAATRLEACIQRIHLFPRERERERLATSVLHGLSDQMEASNAKIDEAAREGGLGCIGAVDTQMLAQQFVSRRLTHDRQAAIKATRRYTNLKLLGYAALRY